MDTEDTTNLLSDEEAENMVQVLRPGTTLAVAETLTVFLWCALLCTLKRFVELKTTEWAFSSPQFFPGLD